MNQVQTPPANRGTDPLAFDNPALYDTHYFDRDALRMKPRIAGTAENWENKVLGADERYVSVVPRPSCEALELRR